MNAFRSIESHSPSSLEDVAISCYFLPIVSKCANLRKCCCFAPFSVSTLENLTSFALIYFHKSRILTHLAYINFPKLIEKVPNLRKLVRFSKPSEFIGNITKRKFFYLLTPTKFFLEFSTSSYVIPKLISKHFFKFH